MINTEYEFYIKNQEEQLLYKKCSEKEYLRTEKLIALEIENGIVLPRKPFEDFDGWMGKGGVLDKDGNFVELSGILDPERSDDKFVFGGKYDYFFKAKEVDETVFYLGPFMPHWGHFLIEYITRLWFYKKNNLDIPIIYCGFDCKKSLIDGNFREVFELLDIDCNKLYDIRMPTKFKKIIVAEQSFLRGKYYTTEYKNLIDCLRSKCTNHISDTPANLYFSRIDFSKNHFGGNKERGEEEIGRVLIKNGFSCISPEKLTLKEQIIYMQQCKRFAVIPGGAAMNSVFLQECAEIIYIKKAHISKPTSDLFMIEQMNKTKKVSYVDCYFKPYKLFPRYYGSGPHFMGITNKFKEFCQRNNMTISINYRFAILKSFIWLTLLRLNDIYKDIF